MVELEEKDLLLASLKGYLEELRESGVDELAFGSVAPSAAPAAVSPAKSVLAAEIAPVAAARPEANVASAAARPAADVAPAVDVASAAEAAAPANNVPAAPAARPAAITAQGDNGARLLFVMSGAGFAGESGALLARIIVAMGFAPEAVCLLSFPPEEARKADLRPALLDKISQVGPAVVVALGETSAQLLLDKREPISRLRGRFHDFRGSKLMATLHPDQLLADESLKRDVWNEMKQVMAALA